MTNINDHSINVICEFCRKKIQKIHIDSHIAKRHKSSQVIKNTAILPQPPIEVQPVKKSRKKQNYPVVFSNKELLKVNYQKCERIEDMFSQLVKFMSKETRGGNGYNFSELSGFLATQVLKPALKTQSIDILNRVLFQYEYYFIKNGEPTNPRYEIDNEAIAKSESNKTVKKDIWAEIISELDDEIYIANRNRQTINVKIIECEIVREVYFYTCLIQSDITDEVLFPEGVRIKFKNINNNEGGMGTVVNINEIAGKLHFQSSSKLSNGSYTANYSTAWLTELLLKNLTEPTIQNKIQESLIWRIILKDNSWENRLHSAAINHNASGLNDSQLETLNHCIQNKITFIWGPPGTGKSTTLAEICRYFYEQKEKTLVTTIANVALDSILLKSIEKLELDIKENRELKGKILRIGKTYSKHVLKKDYLYDINDEINSLRISINEIINEIDLLSQSKFTTEEEIAKLKSQKEQKVHELKNKMKLIYDKAILIYSTGSYTLIDSLIKEMDFENVVIDEISMMNIPFLLWLSKFSIKRIIVAGDFRQLGPISSAAKPNSNNWMKRDVFHILNKEYNFSKSSFVKMLNEQYRMNVQISALINEDFYNNQLITKTSLDNATKCSNFYDNNLISIINIKGNTSFQFTKGGSRINPGTQVKIKELIEKFNDSFTIPCTIGIITPYRAQAKAIQSFLENKNTHHNIKAGTIHTFQGSEADIIILDFVDTEVDSNDKDSKISRLYFNQDGERLINVAISRAKSKLIVLGDLNHLKSSVSYMTTKKFQNVLHKLTTNK